MVELMLIGGFLGAGKTTLIKHLAAQIEKSGKKAGIVTNDQAPALVDTIFLAKSNNFVEEVSGSCFCCNYNGFNNAVEKLAVAGTDFILAEPVGSCTDLSATILQPIKKLEKGKVKLAAFCVLVDPDRLEAILLNGNLSGLHPSALYIIHKQLEEADIIVLSKADKYEEKFIENLLEQTLKAFPGKPVLVISALTGKGIDQLLSTVESIKKPGSHLVNVDYDTYAEGEAVLGWLNMEITLQKNGADWGSFAKSLLSSIADSFAKDNIAIAHVKMLLEGENGEIIGNLTGKKESLTLRGNAPRTNEIRLVLNARAQTSPKNLLEKINEIVGQCCDEEEIKKDTKVVNCLMPGRPNPTHRYSEVVEQ